jgi:hypothetical protein
MIDDLQGSVDHLGSVLPVGQVTFDDITLPPGSNNLVSGLGVCDIALSENYPSSGLGECDSN